MYFTSDCLFHHANLESVATAAETGLVQLAAKGGVSGGTIESAVYMMQETGPLTKNMFHPYFLDAIRSDVPIKELPDHGGPFSPSWSKALQAWAGPFIMDAHNSKIVRRSNALLGYQYGVTVCPALCSLTCDDRWPPCRDRVRLNSRVPGGRCSIAGHLLHVC